MWETWIPRIRVVRWRVDQQGMQQRAREVALALLQRGLLPFEQIAEITGLDKEELEHLKNS